MNVITIILARLSPAPRAGDCCVLAHPGVPLRSTPGFTLLPTPRAKSLAYPQPVNDNKISRYDAMTQTDSLRYFFSPAVQFITTVNGAGADSPTRVLTRKRWPSPVTA